MFYNIRREGQQYAGESYIRMSSYVGGNTVNAPFVLTNISTVTEGQTYSGTTMLLNGRMSQYARLGFKLVLTFIIHV